MGKRIISTILVLTMLLTAFPVTALATGKTQVTTENDDMSLEGTNDFGDLLTEDLKENEAEKEEAAENYPAGYSITELEIVGNTAYVTYEAAEEATLVVGVYTEDGLQLLTSGKVTISPDETAAEVTIEGEMPEYFQAEAYMLDNYDFSPLCDSYHTPMYTKDMQELLASTIDDYDPDKVLNLDDDKTTNFAVFAEDTIIIEEEEGVNTVASVNDETNTYVIENADETIASLKKGDILAYPYGDNEMIIAKVGNIKVNGDTVTITGDEDIEIEEAFEVVKIQTEAKTSDFSVDENITEDGVVYTGMVSDNEEVMLLAADDDIQHGSNEKSISFGFEGDENISGSLDLKVTIEFDFLINFSYQYISFRVSQETSVSVSLALAIPSEPFELPEIIAQLLGGAVDVGFKPKFILEAEMSIEINLSIKQSLGFKYETGYGFDNLSTLPELTPNIEIKGTLKIGIDLGPIISAIDEGIAAISSEMVGGIIVEVTIGDFSSSETQRHMCKNCFDIDISFFIEMKPKLQFFASLTDKLAIESPSMGFTHFLCDAYWCIEHSDFKIFSKCPEIAYKITIEVVDQNGNEVKNANVQIGSDKGNILNTGAGNTVSTFLKNGLHTITATTENGLHGSTKITVSNDARKALIEVGKYGTVVTSGICGPNLTWRYYGSGSLEIKGRGRMFDYTGPYETPWYGGEINNVEIGAGVTTIGEYAFSNKLDLTSITIPNSVTSIGKFAFAYCTGLTDVYYDGTEEDWNKISIGFSNAHLTNAKIHFVEPEIVVSGNCGDNLTWKIYANGLLEIMGTGDMLSYQKYSSPPWYYYRDKINQIKINNGVTSIGMCAFRYCTSLISIDIPDSLTKIGDYAFEDCISLTSVELGESVTSIGDEAFRDCTSLISVELGESVTSIGDRSFSYCSSLTKIELPDSLTSIGSGAFNGCSNLTEVEIPDRVTRIEDTSFHNCSSLTKIELPDSLTSIGSGAFNGCSNLTEVEIPDRVTRIEDMSFCNCSSLTKIELPDSSTSIGSGAFSGCSNLTEVKIPDSVTSIGSSAFNGCISLTEIDIPDSVTSIGNSAFNGCSSLISMVIPDGITTIESNTFNNCSSLASIEIPENVTSIGDYAFRYCDSLTNIEIPGSVTTIGSYAFHCCYNIKSIEIPSNMTMIADHTFMFCTNLTSVSIPASVVNIGYAAFDYCRSLKDVYYSGSSVQWNDIDFSVWNGSLTGATIHYNYTPTTTSSETPCMVSAVKKEAPVMAAANSRAIHGGKYDTEVREDYTLKTASFSDLVPGEQYVMLALVSTEAEDILAADNLLNIMQGIADEYGNLIFQYVQRVPTEVSYVVACGASNKDLKDATITFPEMTANGEVQVVNPTVVYDGKTLKEGRDYIITGTVEFTEAGEYTCTIVGINNYTGSVECKYVCLDSGVLKGDANNDGEVSNADLVLVARYIVELETTLPSITNADMDEDSVITNSDLVALARLIVGF